MHRKRETRMALGTMAMTFAVTLPMLLIAAGSAGIYLYEANSTAVADIQQ